MGGIRFLFSTLLLPTLHGALGVPCLQTRYSPIEGGPSDRKEGRSPGRREIGIPKGRVIRDEETGLKLRREVGWRRKYIRSPDRVCSEESLWEELGSLFQSKGSMFEGTTGCERVCRESG